MSERKGRLLISGRRLLRADQRASLRAARRLFRAARTGARDVGLVFVHDLEMRALNRAWRGIDAPTDVLSFAAHEGDAVAGAEHTLGDLVISVDSARRQARTLGHAIDEEVAVLVAHGLTHLCGLDHERGAAAAEVQRSCEMTLLAVARFDVGLALTAGVTWVDRARRRDSGEAKEHRRRVPRGTRRGRDAGIAGKTTPGEVSTQVIHAVSGRAP